MVAPRVLILRAPGTNCDVETAYAFEKAGGSADRVHINQLLEKPQLADNYQILCLPGGFSYGDDIAAGRILANQIRHHLAETLAGFKANGKLILGICNGFQILIKSGVLLADTDAGMPATLTWNASGRFLDRWVRLNVSGSRCVFLRGIEQMYLPIAHAEGKFMVRDSAVLENLRAGQQLALQYAADDNPNGATADVAGICDETGRVFGLMPHPERHIEFVQHPRWTRETPRDRGDGLAVFENAVGYFE